MTEPDGPTAEPDVQMRSRGSSAAVVMHPSLGRPASDFDHLAARVGDAGYRVLLVDPRGVGQPTKPASAEEVTLHDLAAHLLRAMDDEGISAAHVIGHALGNRVARCLAADHPTRVRSVILLAAGGGVDGDEDARSALVSCFDEDLPDERRFAAIRTAFFAPGNEVPDSWRTGWYPGAAALQGAAVRRTPTEDWWTAGDAPMLVVQGLDDRIAPPANGRRLRDERPSTTLVEIAGAGHALLPEQPAAVAEAVLDFLRIQSSQG